jgi:hypothetical protein
VQHLFALGYVDILGSAQNRFGSFGIDGMLLGVYLFGNTNLVFRKKLLRFATAGSTRAVVVPIDFTHASRIAEVIGYR